MTVGKGAHGEGSGEEEWCPDGVRSWVRMELENGWRWGRDGIRGVNTGAGRGPRNWCTRWVEGGCQWVLGCVRLRAGR